ncbi:MAG: diguanylate cyclase [Bacillota bacterium]|nr:diguanylate cyclase [Bacillota bacterium]
MYSFASISIIALCCYTFLLAAFVAAKKTPVVNSFIMVLISGVLWTGGSFCMRIQIFPSIEFWFQVSLLGMFLICYAFCWFLMEFTDQKNPFLNKLWLILMVGIGVVNIFTGVFLEAPRAVTAANGDTAFIYDFGWPVAVLFIACGAIVVHMFVLMIKYYIDDDFKKKQMFPLLVGVALVFTGELLWMLPALKGFPIDILSALIMVICMIFTLHRRRLFKLTLLLSRESCYCISILVCFGLFFYFLRPIEAALTTLLGHSFTRVVMMTCLLFALFTVMLYILMKNFINKVFIRDEIARANVLKEFSETVSNSLKIDDILGKLVTVINDTIPVNKIYVFIKAEDESKYRMAYSLSPLSERTATIHKENPIIKELRERHECVMMEDFKCLTVYKSMWESEKEQLEDLDASCFIALKDGGDLVGIVAVSGKKDGSRFSYDEISFLDSVGSVCSIAVKNSRLYEKAWYEARIDELTGLLNRKYFYEILNEEFEKNKTRSLALIMVNLDDFKLYNQLYGNKQGDFALKKVGEILRATVGSSGYVARCSGKEFGIILPLFDTMGARKMAETILKQISAMNRNMDEKEYSTRVLTASCGICTVPYGASNVRELMDNADMAVYQVKRSGKNGILVTTGSTVLQGADTAKEREKKQKLDIYEEYAPTIYALTAAIDTKDHYTFSHSENVEYYATELAYALGLNEESVEIIREAALLHDVGKIGIPEEILNKKARLTAEEFETMKGHVMNSVGIIKHLPSLDYVIPAVISHHERWDGGGYPRGLRNEEIPLFGRILCIADSFDAMISMRSYKKPFPVDYALEEIKNNAGTQFDPALAEAFVKLVGSDKITPKLVELKKA